MQHIKSKAVTTDPKGVDRARKSDSPSL
jgi:hypothetical protein